MADVNGISILRAAARDVEGLSELRRQFWRDQESSGLLEPAPGCAAPDILLLLQRARTHLLVAADSQGELKGYLLGQTKLLPGVSPVRVSSVEEIYVREDARGGRVAAHLVEAAVASFKKDGTDRIQLRVLQANKGGASFWTALGFEPYLTVYELPPRSLSDE